MRETSPPSSPSWSRSSTERSRSGWPSRCISGDGQLPRMAVARGRNLPMPLPSVLEIVPPIAPVRAAITVPGSKSITNRALVLAALADGATTLTGALWSEDTQVMVDCLRRLGFEVRVDSDPDDASNRTIAVVGRGGVLPAAGTPEAPLE